MSLKRSCASESVFKQLLRCPDHRAKHSVHKNPSGGIHSLDCGVLLCCEGGFSDSGAGAHSSLLQMRAACFFSLRVRFLLLLWVPETLHPRQTKKAPCTRCKKKMPPHPQLNKHPNIETNTRVPKRTQLRCQFS